MDKKLNIEDVKNGRFVVTFPLKVREDQDHVLQKRFRIAEVIRDRLFDRMKERLDTLLESEAYKANQKSMADILQEMREKENLIKTYEEMTKNSKNKEEIRLLKDEIKEMKAQIRLKKADLKPYYKNRNDLLMENNLTKFGFFKEVKDIYKPFNKNIDSLSAISIAETVWRGFEKYLFDSKSKKLRKKRKNTMKTVRGRNNESGIRFKDGNLLWNGLCMPVKIDANNPYEIEAFQSEIAYCCIQQRWIHGKNYYFVQIIFKGVAPAKYRKATGEFVRALGEGKVNIEIQPTQITIQKESKKETFSLCPNLDHQKELLKEIEEKMERSRRATNPNNFDEKGRALKNTEENSLTWIQSKNYRKLKIQKHDLCEKVRIQRKIEHEKLSNKVLSYGSSFIISSIDAKKEQEKDGKRKGRVILDYAPASFRQILIRKIEQLGGVVNYER